MLIPLGHHDWQVLRAVARSRKPVPGKALWLNMARNTRDGAFLDELVRVGLLAAEPLKGADPKLPAPFQKAYSLTPLGKHAAEYGEYEADLAAIRKPHTALAPAGKKRE